MRFDQDLRRTLRLRGMPVAALGFAMLAMVGCGSTDDGAVAAGGPTTSPDISVTSDATGATDSVGPTETTGSIDAVGGDAGLAAMALLAPEDIGDGWRAGGDQLTYPNSVDLARGIPACTDVAELVFDGGAEHGAGLSGVMAKYSDPVFVYVAVFPTVEAATAMMEAVKAPEFDECWARFSEVATAAMPLGATAVSYESSSPPALELDADDYTVEFLEGTVDFAGTTFSDTCVCVFAQVGRGIVEVHSTEKAVTLEQRATIVQTAIDKMESTLAAG